MTKLTKQYWIFVGLKIAEGIGFIVVVFMCNWVGRLFCLLTEEEEPWIVCFLIGFFMLVFGGFIVWGLIELIKANWKIAKRWSGRGN